MKIKFNIGKMEINAEAADFTELAKEVSALSQAGQCGLCKSENIALGFKVVKGKEGTDKSGESFKYYSAKCLDCTAEANFGMYKAGGMYLKNWEKWEGKKTEDF